MSATGLDFTITNRGRLGAQLQARSNNVKGAPFSYTVGAGHALSPTLKTTGRFDVSFHGPNGFFRRFAGSTSDPAAGGARSPPGGRLVLTLHNRSDRALPREGRGRLRPPSARSGSSKGARKEVRVGRWPPPTAGTTCW